MTTEELLNEQEDRIFLSRQYPNAFPELYDYCPAVYDPHAGLCSFYKRLFKQEGKLIDTDNASS